MCLDTKSQVCLATNWERKDPQSHGSALFDFEYPQTNIFLLLTPPLCSNSRIQGSLYLQKEPLSNGLTKPHLWQGSNLELCKLKLFSLLLVKSYLTLAWAFSWENSRICLLRSMADGSVLRVTLNPSSLKRWLKLVRGQITSSIFFRLTLWLSFSQVRKQRSRMRLLGVYR